MKKAFYNFLFFLLIFTLTCFCPSFLAAQVNESDTLKFKASLSSTGFWQAGNVQTWIFRARTDVSFKSWEKWVFKTTNSYVYQAFGGNKADEDFLSLNFLYFDPEQRVYPLVLGFISTNFRRQIDTRTLLGTGFTIKAIDKQNAWLKFSLTSEYEQTSFSNNDFNIAAYDGDQSINTLRGTVWVNGKYQLFGKKMIITHESYYQPSLEQTDNYRWQADVGFEFPIWKFFNFKINYLHTFESIVIEGQKQEDQFLTFGFTLKNF